MFSAHRTPGQHVGTITDFQLRETKRGRLALDTTLELDGLPDRPVRLTVDSTQPAAQECVQTLLAACGIGDIEAALEGALSGKRVTVIFRGVLPGVLTKGEFAGVGNG